jgi:hypothetical protein
MNDTIVRFSLLLRGRMQAVHERVEALDLRSKLNPDRAEDEVREHAQALAALSCRHKAAQDAAHAEVTRWAEDAHSDVAQWKTRRDANGLAAHADRADRAAQAAFELAIASLQRAELVMLQAWLACSDAEAANRAKAA